MPQPGRGTASAARARFSTFNEAPLHAALKAWVARPGDALEAPVDGFVIDIRRGRQLIEIQTGNFGALKRKLDALLERHPLHLVYPIAAEKWILKHPPGPGARPSRRKSPKRGHLVHVFGQLVHIPTALTHPNFTLEVLLVRAEEVWDFDGRRGWRRGGWVVRERRLIEVLERARFDTPAALGALLPPLDAPFTTGDLARSLGQPRRVAQQMAYCLRQLQIVEPVGKRGNAVRYVRAAGQQP